MVVGGLYQAGEPGPGWTSMLFLPRGVKGSTGAEEGQPCLWHVLSHPSWAMGLARVQPGPQVGRDGDSVWVTARSPQPQLALPAPHHPNATGDIATSTAGM